MRRDLTRNDRRTRQERDSLRDSTPCGTERIRNRLNTTNASKFVDTSRPENLGDEVCAVFIGYQRTGEVLVRVPFAATLDELSALVKTRVVTLVPLSYISNRSK